MQILSKGLFFSALVLLEPKENNTSRMTYVFNLDLGEYQAGIRLFVSKKKLDRLIVHDARPLVTHTRRYFQQQIVRKNMTESDGCHIGIT